MADPLHTAIARQLADSNVGLFRTQLLVKIDDSLTDGNIERISLALNQMKNAGRLNKSPRHGIQGSRWSLTPQGRAYFSTLNQDEDHDDETPKTDTTPHVETETVSENQGIRHADVEMAENHDPATPLVLAPEPGNQTIQLDETQTTMPDFGATVDDWHDAVMHATNPEDQQLAQPYMAAIPFDLNKTLDRALYGLVKLIRDCADVEPIAIENKPVALKLLETCEHNPMFSAQTRTTFARIRLAVNQMEDAA